MRGNDLRFSPEGQKRPRLLLRGSQFFSIRMVSEHNSDAISRICVRIPCIRGCQIAAYGAEDKASRGPEGGKVCSLVGLKILFCLDQWREKSRRREGETSPAEHFQIWSASRSQIKYTTVSYISPHFYSAMDGRHRRFLDVALVRQPD